MVSKKEHLPLKRIPAGDAAVDGLFAGLMAGLLMAVVLMLLALLRAEMPNTLLARFGMDENGSPVLGLLRHMAVSGTYGLLFGLLSRFLPVGMGRMPALAAGAGYGFLLFALAELVILPGTGSPLLALPPVDFAAAHLVYGLALAVFLRKIASI